MDRPARRVVLELLSAIDARETLPVAALLRGCELVGVQASTARVALSRLKAEAKVESPARGQYRLGPAAQTTQRAVTGWRTAGDDLIPWDGGWLGVLSGGLSRSDRGALRRRDRALRLLGFRALVIDAVDHKLHLRPDNRRGGASAMRGRLVALGCDDAALVARLDGLDARAAAAARGLWDAQELARTYRRLTSALEEASNAIAVGDRAAMARRAFLLGGEAIHHIVLDPLLPSTLVDTDARGAFFDAMRRFDRQGRALWIDLLRPREAVSHA